MASSFFSSEYQVNKVYQKAAETRETKKKPQGEKQKIKRTCVFPSFPHTKSKNTLSPVRSEAQLSFLFTSSIPHFMH